MKIAAVIMVKNESKRIHVTLDSLKGGKVDGLIVYDTGSDDGTPRLMETLSPVPIDVKLGEFVDFATSLNVLLDYADEIAEKRGYDAYVLLEANDEYRGDRIADDAFDANDGYFVKRVLKYGPTDTMEFWNLKVLKAKVPMRYVGAIHEYLEYKKRDEEDEEKHPNVMNRIESFVIYQDRTMDDDKTLKRWHRDRKILEKEYRDRPTDTRTVFYLAQTYDCLGEKSLAFEKYAERSKMDGGFEEERWRSLLNCGKIKRDTGDEEEAVAWYMKSIDHTCRAEALCDLADIYRRRKRYRLAYAFARMACELKFPHEALLFVDTKVYEYTRWHIMSLIAWYVRDQVAEAMDIGAFACAEALKKGYNPSLDKSNLKFYRTTEKEKELNLPTVIDVDKMERRRE